MAKFKQHIPDFCTGFEKKIFQFSTFKELMQNQNELLPNYKWCYDNYYKNTQVLMQETLDNKKWYVIGFVKDFDLSKYLPKIVYGE